MASQSRAANTTTLKFLGKKQILKLTLQESFQQQKGADPTLTASTAWQPGVSLVQNQVKRHSSWCSTELEGVSKLPAEVVTQIGLCFLKGIRDTKLPFSGRCRFGLCSDPSVFPVIAKFPIVGLQKCPRQEHHLHAEVRGILGIMYSRYLSFAMYNVTIYNNRRDQVRKSIGRQEQEVSVCFYLDCWLTSKAFCRRLKINIPQKVEKTNKQ